MNKRFYCLSFVFSAFFVVCLCQVKPIYGQDQDLGTLYASFRVEKQKPCGQRSEAVRIGKLIVEKYSGDKDNQEVILYVKERTELIEKEDKKCNQKPVCQSNNQTDWRECFTFLKEAIEAEGDTSLGLDLVLTLVAIGYDRLLNDKDVFFAGDTLKYARLAIQRIEARQVSKTGRWGVFETFDSKENALMWMNYITAYTLYHHTNEKQEALNYFYKAAQFKNKDSEWMYYQIVRSFYLNRMVGLTNELRGNDNVDKYLFEVKGIADRLLIASANLYRIAREDIARKDQVACAYQNLTDIYNFRFNLPSAARNTEIEIFLPKLLRQPVPDASNPIEPIFDEPIEVKLIRQKSPQVKVIEGFLKAKPMKKDQSCDGFFVIN